MEGTEGRRSGRQQVRSREYDEYAYVYVYVYEYVYYTSMGMGTYLAISKYPQCAAACSGVQPSRSRTSIAAPRSSSHAASSALLSMHACTTATHSASLSYVTRIKYCMYSNVVHLYGYEWSS